MTRLIAVLSWTLAAAAAVPETPAAREAFLGRAEIADEAPAGRGSTGSEKVTLVDGDFRHLAHFQAIDEYKPLWKGKDGTEERDFRDSWKFNVAAYRLARLLGLADRVPPAIEREVGGRRGSLVWWVDDVLMDEKDRKLKNIEPPDQAAWREQMDVIRVFDQLIHNMDRNRENLLITKTWHVWMIDHTRAFRTSATLRNEAAITTCPPPLLKALKHLKRSEVAREIASYVTAPEIDGLMTRRNRIVELLEAHAQAGVKSTAPKKSLARPTRTAVN
jgi:hypothetical protein